jgi:hypothetical protein
MQAPAPRLLLQKNSIMSYYFRPLHMNALSSALRSHRMLGPLRMPKNNKKGKAATAKVAEDFDDMLAEFREADLTNPAASSSAHTTNSNSRSSSSSSSTSTSASRAIHPSGAGVGETMPEEDMIQAAIRGDVKQM